MGLFSIVSVLDRVRTMYVLDGTRSSLDRPLLERKKKATC